MQASPRADYCPRIVQPGDNVWRTVTADASGVLVDAADYYRALYQAARQARRSILMSGWEFDSGVPLLRGGDVTAGEEVRLLEFLNELCARTPDLHVCLLVWNYHPILFIEREWLQRIVFRWMTNARLQFRVLDADVAGGSHHQKFVVIDGQLAFLGGMDVCEGRWDDRRHLAENPLRRSRGWAQKPYHDVQAYLRGGDGPAVLQDYFFRLWRRAGGTPPPLTRAWRAGEEVLPRGALVFGPARLALSRTEPGARGASIREIERLFVDAIGAAERLIYAETQYFSSRCIFDALVRRMRDRRRPRLQIVVVVNQRAEALKEEIAVGLRQVEIIARLREVAAETGHAWGCYDSLPAGPAADPARPTYIHSKVLIVDDRFLTVGSANFTNRSMGLDSELHVSWEAGARDAPIVRAIRRVRVSLLAEHAGLSGLTALRAVAGIEELVPFLDACASTPGARLRAHPAPTPAQQVILTLVDPQTLPFDSDGAA